MVNGDSLSVDSLDAKLKELGVSQKTNIRIVPSPEAGAAAIERVQRQVRLFK